MSRIYKSSDYKEPYDERILRIKPEGWVNNLTFKYGHKHVCGQAEDGVSVSIDNEAGGVMTLDDLVAIRDMVNDHIALVLYRKAQPDLDLLTPLDETEDTKSCNCDENCC